MKVVESVVEKNKETVRDLQAINNEYSQCAGLLGDRLFKQHLFEQEIVTLKETMTRLNKEAAKCEAFKRVDKVTPTPTEASHNPLESENELA